MTRRIPNKSGARRILRATLISAVPVVATAAVVEAKTPRTVSVAPATRAIGESLSDPSSMRLKAIEPNAGDFGISVSRSAWMLVRRAPATSTIHAGRRFKVSGSVPAPLYPGATPVAFRVTLTNPNPFPISVTRLGTVGVHPINAPGCEARWFEVTLPGVPRRGVSVAAHGGTVTLGATARMLDVNMRQDACQGKRLTLSYTGSAR